MKLAILVTGERISELNHIAPSSDPSHDAVAAAEYGRESIYIW